TLQTRADICCLHHSAGDHRSGLILDCSKQPSSGLLRDSGMSSKKQSKKHAQYTTTTHGSSVRKGGGWAKSRMKRISGKAKNEPLTVHFPLIRIGQVHRHRLQWRERKSAST